VSQNCGSDSKEDEEWTLDWFFFLVPKIWDGVSWEVIYWRRLPLRRRLQESDRIWVGQAMIEFLRGLAWASMMGPILWCLSTWVGCAWVHFDREYDGNEAKLVSKLWPWVTGSFTPVPWNTGSWSLELSWKKPTVLLERPHIEHRMWRGRGPFLRYPFWLFPQNFRFTRELSGALCTHPAASKTWKPKLISTMSYRIVWLSPAKPSPVDQDMG
jgi:hypothetical protein